MGVGWPSDGSQSFMIGPTGATSTDAPVGWIYTVGDTTLAEDGRYLLAVIIDNEGTAYGDSVPLINVNQNDGFRRVSQITLDLSAGDHRFAISARNAEPTSGPNPIAIAMELWKADQAGFPTELVFQTDDTWRGVFYPDRPPGMTPGQAALICLAEAQDRDALTWLVPSFTAEVDSDGRAWPEYGDLACKAGRTPIWKFIEQLIGSGYVDSRIALNGRRWDLYVADGLGEPSGVAYTTDPDPEVGNLHAWVEVTTAPRAEAILAKSRFGWSERGTATSGNRVEGVLGLGALQSPAEVDRWTDAQLALYSQARIQHDIEVTPVGPADTPLIAYRPRDLITVDGDEHRVVSVAWARDRNGRVTYTPRIGARLDEEDERLRRAVESMVAGTFSGDSKIATPLDQVAYQSQANPDPPAGSICFRADGFGTVEATDVVHAFTDDNIGLLVHTGGFTIDANGLIVPPPSPAAMAWDLTAIVNGTAAGSSYLQYMSIRLRTYNAAGSSYDSSHEVRLEWQDLPGGPTAWGSVPMCTLIVPAGGKIGITVANFNTGDADVEFEIGGHSIAPADYEVPG
jgi:hypothetical protein